MRISLQTKILIPVITILIAVPATLVIVVDRYITDEGRKDANRALFTAEDVFRQLLENRSRDLLLRFRNVVDEASYKSIATLVTPDMSRAAETTVSLFLAGRLADYNDDTAVMLIVPGSNLKPIGSQRGIRIDLADFARAAAPISTEALGGGSATGLVSLGGVAFDVASVPILLPEGRQVGALTVGVRLGTSTVQELKRFTHADILLVANGQVVVSTVGEQDPAWLSDVIKPASAMPGDAADNPPMLVVDPLTGEHFLALSGAPDDQSGPNRGLHYVLLSSLEASRRVLEDTERVLIEVSVAGILLSVAVVWFSVRRIIHPLSELRDTAEAVGRGDFSRRITRFSNDESGDLAEAFNRMTVNLQTSLAELEKTVETLKATQAQLVQSGKLSAVGQFVAGVAHELNNPLTAVIGFADLLTMTVTDPKLRSQLDVIGKSAHRCHKIVHNLLSFARQHEPERKLTHVNATIDEVLEFMAYDLRTSSLKIVNDLDPTLPAIMADPHQLQQVFVNIISNARQAILSADMTGTITVRTRLKDRCVRIEISDTGPGISPANLAKIFDPFFTTKPLGQGTGLGLSLVYGMIQEHGGTITATSVLGEGATFAIDLPVLAYPSTPVILSDQPAGGIFRASSPRGTTVLVVDDEEWILGLARELLTWDGHDVETALGAEQCLEVLRSRRVDLIVSDWKMPGMNGIQLYERLKEEHPSLAERMLFMTGDVINDTLREFLTANGKTCISKPFAIEEFQNAVAAILGNSAQPFISKR